MSLYDYLKKNLTRADPHSAIDHSMRAELHADGRISFYIHPERRDGDTPTFWISEVGIFPKHDGLSKQQEFLTHPAEWREKQLAAMSEDET